jgi:aspartyl-tRNA(Asn)/glutamyl-tRNA(Gln) amidotransferase subunit A
VTSSDPLYYMGLSDVARMLRKRQVSCVEVHDATFRRIDEVEPQLEAFITLLREESLGEAVEADRTLARGESTGPLHGIPVSLKDLYDTAGIRTTAASQVMADRVPSADATVTARLKSAGAIIIGKANQTEFAFGGTDSAFGALKNPWSLEHSPGSSSSGSGASVAAGMGYASMGTDTGGSVRIPAAMCGVVGLKPTYGRVSRHGIVPLSWTLDHAGPLTRTVTDAALVLQAIAGYDPRDPTSSRRPVPSYLRALPRDLSGVTLGVPSAFFYEDLDPDVAARLEEAHGVLRKLGARLKKVNIPHAAYSMAALVTIIESEAASVHWSTLIERPDDYQPVFRARAMRGLLTPAVSYLDAQRLRGLLIDDFEAALSGVDALVTPTCPTPPFRMDQTPTASAMVSTIGRFTNLANMTGLPALSVPCGFNRDQLPIGMQLIGRSFDERTLIRIGNAYQSATDWRLRRPPL